MISAKGGAVGVPSGVGAVPAATSTSAAMMPAGAGESQGFADLGIDDADSYVLKLAAAVEDGSQLQIAEVARGPFSFRIERPGATTLSVVAKTSEKISIGFRGKLVLGGVTSKTQAVSWPLQFAFPLGADRFIHRIDVAVPLIPEGAVWFRGVGLLLNPIAGIGAPPVSVDVVGAIRPIFDFVDRICREFPRELGEFLELPTVEAMRERLPAFKSRWNGMIEAWRMMRDRLNLETIGDKRVVVGAFASSQGQLLNAISMVVYLLGMKLGKNIKPQRSDLANIPPDGLPVNFSGRRFLIPYSRFEIASSFLSALKGENAKVVWNPDGSVSIGHPGDWRTNYEGARLLHNLSWPADLSRHDIVDLLNVLGWQITITDNGEGEFTAQINFGETKVEDI